MELLVGRFLYGIVGFLYLWIRYRNQKKVMEIKKEYYEDSYAVTGAQLVFSIFGVILFVLLSLMLLACIYAIFKHPPSAY